MSLFSVDLENIYRQTFGGSKPILNVKSADVTQLSGSALTAEYLGKEIWLPVKFVNVDESVFGANEVLLPYAVIKISGSKTIVKTPLAERQGTVKELYSVDDYAISIKGFVIDEENRIWPEKELQVLKKLCDHQASIELDNALTNIFLDKDQRVTITKFDLPEVEGGGKHIRPFSMEIESDSVFTLELE